MPPSRCARHVLPAACVAVLAIIAAACNGDGRGTAPAGRQRATLVAVGDIACGTEPAPVGDECRYEVVAEVAVAEEPDLFLALGDVQYATPSGDLDFSFYDEAFGALRPVTLPTGGDEDWDADRDAFLGYFGNRTNDDGYDSLVLAGWHIVVLNSRDCFDDDGCRAGSPQ